MNKDDHDSLHIRFELAETALRLLETGKLPHLQRLFSRARCDLREITDPNAFNNAKSSDADLTAELNASRQVAVIRSTPDCVSRFHVFYEQRSNVMQEALLAKVLQSFMAVTYAAIGLDMTALTQADEKDSGESGN